ncbi:MAG: hypothetical protein NC191_08790 [Muribaculaceae bacterium]|nr:hypothetical protein [Muribaculaceae bacterium]
MVDWVTAMDLCASEGLINYDAPARILGQQPRYMYRPRFEDIPKLTGPDADIYDTNNGNIVRPTRWKRQAMKALLGIGAALGTVALIQKGKLNVTNIKKFAKGVFNLVKKPFVWLGKVLGLNSATPPAPTP